MKSNKVSKSVPQIIVDRVIKDAEIQDIVALRFLLVINYLYQDPQVGMVTVGMVMEKKRQETDRKIPKSLADKSLKVLTDNSLINIHTDEAVEITEKGISAAFTMQLRGNEHILRKVLPPECTKEKFLETSEIYLVDQKPV